MTACAMRFLVCDVLGQTERRPQIPLGRQPQRLPEVLSRAEVAALLGAPMSMKTRTFLMTAYSSGLRLSELCKLRGCDSDSAPDRLCIRRRPVSGATSSLAAPPRWAARASNAISVAASSGCSVPAATVTAHSARAPRATPGAAPSSPICCPCLIPISPSPSRMPSTPWPGPTRAGSTAQVLPPGFTHIRHYGLLSPAVKTVRMVAARAALLMPAPNAQAQEDAAAFLKRVAGIDVACCPLCRIGRWRTIELLPASQSTRQDLDLQCRGPP